jgi:hypothetical protein
LESSSDNPINVPTLRKKVLDCSSELIRTIIRNTFNDTDGASRLESAICILNAIPAAAKNEMRDFPEVFALCELAGVTVTIFDHHHKLLARIGEGHGLNLTWILYQQHYYTLLASDPASYSGNFNEINSWHASATFHNIALQLERCGGARHIMPMANPDDPTTKKSSDTAPAAQRDASARVSFTADPPAAQQEAPAEKKRPSRRSGSRAASPASATAPAAAAAAAPPVSRRRGSSSAPAQAI